MTDPGRQKSSKSKYNLLPEGCMTSNEWGVPDWRDASNYGDVSDWSDNRWRWEFYRRRDDLRQYFDEMVEKAYQDQLSLCVIEGFEDFELLFNGKAPNEPGFVVGVKIDEMDRFGYLAVPNPRIGDQPEELIQPIKQYTEMYLQAASRRVENKERRAQIRCQIELVGGPLDEDIEVLGSTILEQLPLIPSSNEVTVKFALDEPIGPQLEETEKILREHQIKRHGKRVITSKHKDKWLGYLRTLDARADGAKWSEIATIHPETAQTPQSASNKWDSASALRFNL